MKKLLLVVAFLPGLIQAEYKYTDSDGVVHTRPEKKGLPRHLRQPTEAEQLQAQLQAQQQAIEYYERQIRLQQYMAIRGMAYPVPVRHYNSGISQQIGNMKYNFNSNGVSTEQTIGNKTFTNGQTR